MSARGRRVDRGNDNDKKRQVVRIADRHYPFVLIPEAGFLITEHLRGVLDRVTPCSRQRWKILPLAGDRGGGIRNIEIEPGHSAPRPDAGALCLSAASHAGDKFQAV